MTETNPRQFKEGGSSTRSVMREVVRPYKDKIPSEEYSRVWGHIKPSKNVDNYHATTLAVKEANDPRLKARLLSIYVQDQTENYSGEGGRARAIGMMAKADVAQLPSMAVSHLNENFAFLQYDLAVKEGDTGDAWRIARTMLTKREKIVRTKDSPSEAEIQYEEHQKGQWEIRENNSFARYVDKVLRENNSAVDIVDDAELKMLFSRMVEREEHGFQGEKISYMASEVARRVIYRELDSENLNFALLYASAAGMPQASMDALRQNPENVLEIFDAWRAPSNQEEAIQVFPEAKAIDDQFNKLAKKAAKAREKSFARQSAKQ